MKHPEFNINKARWDAWHALHNTFGHRCSQPFVLFDTGELIVTGYDFKPELRRRYADLNLWIVATHDHWCPKLKTEDGEAVKAAWLPSQTLLVDVDTRHVVNIDHGEFTAQVPTRFVASAKAYFPGAGLPPVGRAISVKTPKPITPEQRSLLESLRASCKAWAAMSEEAPKMQSRTHLMVNQQYSIQHSNRYIPDPTYYKRGSVFHSHALTLAFNTMTNGERMQIAECGYCCDYEMTSRTRLLLA